MKRRIKQIVFITACFLCVVAANAWAQEAGMSDTEVSTSRDVTEGDKSTFTPGEDARYIPQASGVYAPSDSITLQIHDFPMQRAAQKTAEKTSEKQSKPKDDSILTYNFLYYIIQKYKLQDIID